MQRVIYWAWLSSLTFGILATLNGQAAAQRVPDPAPVVDDEALDGELPLPQLPIEAAPSVRTNGQAFLGVTFDPDIRNAAVARSVTPGSPADLAGMTAGDTIVSLNGQQVRAYDDVLRAVSAMRPGDVLDLALSRRVTIETQVVLNSQPATGGARTSYRVESEQLPAPTNDQQQRLRGLQGRVNSSFMQPRQSGSAPTNRPQTRQPNRVGNADRDNDSDDRPERGLLRGRFFRRRG
jgi:membrane-associated protease RseP (regulator of RpoE activity)